MIVIDQLIKEYPDGSGVIRALNLPELKIETGEKYALVGPSGSGKSTLLHCLSGLTKPTSGTIIVDDVNLGEQSVQALAKWRGQKVGYVLQTLNLLPYLSAEDNILSSAFFAGIKLNSELKDEVKKLAQEVGIDGLLHKKPKQLSQGEQQRVAIIRALIKNPAYIFADEPSASLDQESAISILDLLMQFANQYGSTLIVSTHDPIVQSKFEKSIRLVSDSSIANSVLK